jgi:hypothetical protein
MTALDFGCNDARDDGEDTTVEHVQGSVLDLDSMLTANMDILQRRGGIFSVRESSAKRGEHRKNRSAHTACSLPAAETWRKYCCLLTPRFWTLVIRRIAFKPRKISWVRENWRTRASCFPSGTTLTYHISAKYVTKQNSCEASRIKPCTNFEPLLGSSFGLRLFVGMFELMTYAKRPAFLLRSKTSNPSRFIFRTSSCDALAPQF